MMAIPLLYFFISSLTYEVSYSKNIKNLEMWKVVLRLALKPYFAELILAIDLSKTVF